MIEADGRPTETSTRPSRLKPKSCPSRLPRLRPSIVEPATSTTESVACTTSSALRANEARSPAVRPEPRSASIGSVRVANHAGAVPKSSPVTSARLVAKASTSGDGVVSIGSEARAGERQRQQEPGGAHRHDQTGQGTSDREQDAFDERLGDDLAARGSHGQAYRGLAAARHRAGQQQVGDVGAGDQQHQRADRHQDAQAAPVLLLHHADAGAGGHHGDHLLGQDAIDLGQPVRAGNRPRAASTAAAGR